MSFEKGLLDKILNKGVLGKRQIGRPLKHNYVNKQSRGILEMMYKPRNPVEKVFGSVIHGFLPVISYFTYRFHVERARVGGFRVEDTYFQKFFREPYVTWHIYAQNFHPSTLNERVRNVVFYRKTKTLFKGFSVPDWAHDNRKEGWDVDAYSREAWDKAMSEFNSEWTPMPWAGDRLDPNVLNWLRIEHIGKGYSSRYFYNEVPKPTWYRHGGHLDEEEKALYSFKYGDQHYEDVLGFDVSTEEGRQAFQAEVDRWAEMTPEIAEAYDNFSVEGDVANKEYISTEPHFQRALAHYRKFAIEQTISQAIDKGDLEEGDAEAAKQFFDETGMPSANLISMGQKGLLGDDGSFESLLKVLKIIRLEGIEFDTTTTKPLDKQLIEYFDAAYDVKEADVIQALPVIITDPRERAKVISLLDSGEAALPEESSKQLT